MTDFNFNGFVELAARLAELNAISSKDALEALSLVADAEWQRPHDEQGRVLVTLGDGRQLALQWPRD